MRADTPVIAGSPATSASRLGLIGVRRWSGGGFQIDMGSRRVLGAESLTSLSSTPITIAGPMIASEISYPTANAVGGRSG